MALKDAPHNWLVMLGGGRERERESLKLIFISFSAKYNFLWNIFHIIRSVSKLLFFIRNLNFFFL